MKMKHVANRRRSVSSRAFIALLALVLVIGCVAGGTVAWLVAKTEPVVNTFTYGNINIALAETTGKDYKIIPGTNIEKDPKVTVTAGSEACWLFVKADKLGTFVADKVTYAIADGWTQGNGTEIPSNVYYREVSAEDAKNGVSYYVLAGNTTYPNGVINVSDTLSKTDVDQIAAGEISLTFTAYAVQKENIADAKTAWENANA